jgi:hypothetical protein
MVRCSPDCPYDDCVILTNIPPIQLPQEQMFEDGEQGDSNDSKSDSKPSDSRDNNDPGGTASQDRPSTGQKPPPSKGTGRGDSKPSPSPSQERQNDSGNDPAERPDNTSADGNSAPKDARETPRPERPPTGDGRPQSGQAQKQPPRPQPVIPEYQPVFDTGKPLPSLEHGYGATEEPERDPRKPKKPKASKKVLTDAVFRQQLKNIMIDNAFDRRVRGRKRGKLDMKSLYKVPAKRENIFTLKEARKNKRYNVLLLVDESGSMGGIKAKTAADCAVFSSPEF